MIGHLKFDLNPETHRQVGILPSSSSEDLSVNC
jgi:hypothetical protein